MTSPDALEQAGESPGSSPIVVIIAVFLGGVIGTGARMGLSALSTLFDPASAADVSENTIDNVLAFSDPALLMTLAVNLLGSLCLGIIVGAHWPARLEWLRAGLGTGVLGAFTTFSFVMLAFAVLGLSSAWAWGLLVIGLVGGFLLAAVGMQIGAGIAPPPPARGEAHTPDAEEQS